ncbi:MAG: hypothetical protein K0R17_2237 [Rariglobus sp.]|jgi:hypothetical protein|nr:hypothetical protein [Rariglobus sp.]
MSIQFPSTLRDLQEAITNHLKGCSALAGIEVFDRRKADLESEIDNQLTNVGASIFVSEIDLKDIAPDAPGISSDAYDVTVVIFTAPTSNDSGRDSAALEEIVMRRLHQWTPGVEGCGVITIDPDPMTTRTNKKKTIRDILFHGSVTLDAGID